MVLNPDSHWYPLVVTTQLPVRSPPLLIQRSFTSNTYSIYLTDLTYIWGETLSRKEIVQRALNEDTSIDPSEDASQMRILLEKLKEALSLCGEDDNEDIDVEIQAVPSKSSASKGTILQLKVTYELPEPLQPLLWTFKLQPLPQKQLTKMLLLPLISLTSLHSTEIQTLLRVIKDKDIVLEKMQDSLEDSKVSVASILGGGASRRRGLEKFDEQKWRSQILENKAGDSSRPEKIVKSLFVIEDRRGKIASANEGFGQEWEEVVSKMEEFEDNFRNGKDWWDEIEATPRPKQKEKKSKGFESDESGSDSQVRTVSSKRGNRVGPKRAGDTSYKSLSKVDLNRAGVGGKKEHSSHSDDEDEFEVCRWMYLQPHRIIPRSCECIVNFGKNVQKTPPSRSKSAPKVEAPPSTSPPPSRKVSALRKGKPTPRQAEESTTEEEDDLDIPPPKSTARTSRAKLLTPAPPSSPPHKQFAQSPSPPSPLPPPRELSFSEESRAVSGRLSKPLSGSSTPTHSSPPPPQAAQAVKIGGRIGTIGGKKPADRESPPPRPPYPEISGDADKDEENTNDGEHKTLVKGSAPLGKIGGKVVGKIGGRIGGQVGGIIGGKKIAGGDDEDVKDGEATRKFDLPTRGGTPQASRENPRPNMKNEVPSHDPMDEEAADRKRRQLQQDLEAKQRAPAKKKRKF